MMIEKSSPLVPKLRFPEFREALPWSIETLGRLFNERKETGFSELPLLSVTDQDGVIPQEKTNRKNTSNSNKSKYLRVVPGDIAYNTMRMWEGRSARVGMEGVISPAYTVCQPNVGTNSYFFAYYFKTRPLIEQFRKYSQGLVKDTLNLKYEPFSLISVGFPSPNEQQNIADCLGSLDDLIAAEGRKLEALRQHKQGLMQQLFPQPGETVPKLRFPEFRDLSAWKLKPLGSLGTFMRGLTYSSNDVAKEGLTVLRSSNIQDGRLVLDSDLVHIGKSCPPSLLLQDGDVAICMSNGSKILVGKSAEYKGGYIGNVTVGAFCSIFRASLDFAKIIFKTPQYIDFIAREISGGNINNLKNSDLEEFKFPVPADKNEQHKIADCIGSLDDLIAAENQRLEALRQHKQGLMQKMFPELERK